MIVLVGFMGSGKSTVGRLLAQQTGLPFADTDDLISKREGSTVAEVFQTKGEPYFREIERAVVTDLLEGNPAVVALGGGAVGDPVIAAALEWHTVVHLETSFTEVWHRLKDDESRPLMRTGDPRDLFEQRLPRYKELASFSVSTEGRSPSVIADEISTLVMKNARSDQDHPASVGGNRVVTVALRDRPYDVIVGKGLLDAVGELLPAKPGKAFLVTHPSLRSLAFRVADSLDAAGISAQGLDVPEGEASKDLEVAGQLLTRLADAEAHRDDIVVSVGGGVVSDLAGFVASVYARGLACAHIPTTLLGQVDAAIGGKTGVNLARGKNLIGTFHQPSLVVCDVGVLGDLPGAELRSGLAEVVKYGLIADPSLLDLIVKGAEDIFARVPSILEEVVARSAWIKAGIVASDEKEHGLRAHLNYGHTFAHAIEQASGYGSIRHGEAVAIGMMAAAYTARAMGWLDDEGVAIHRQTLEAVGLPVTARLTLEGLEPAWRRDKKFDRGVRFVLLSAIGSPVTGVEVERRYLETALDELAEGASS